MWQSWLDIDRIRPMRIWGRVDAVNHDFIDRIPIRNTGSLLSSYTNFVYEYGPSAALFVPAAPGKDGDESPPAAPCCRFGVRSAHDRHNRVLEIFCHHGGRCDIRLPGGGLGSAQVAPPEPVRRLLFGG